MQEKGKLQSIHFVGIGGVGMGSFAVALANHGHRVTGSDGALYEPMKSVLAKSGISLIEGFHAETVSRLKPDLVVVGNVIRKDNVEVREWLKTGTRFQSFPEAVRALLIGDRRSIVCAGTHGKTTTTSWTAFLLRELGLKPSYLIGGVPRDLPAGCALSDGDIFVGEGDEYDSAFFDKGPKFLHYYPHYAILANIEFDHADIYRDLDHVKSSFEKLVALLPGDGLCIARFDDSNVMEVVKGSLSPVQTFGLGQGALWRLGKLEEDEHGFAFEIIYRGRSAGTFRSPLFGEHNLLNLLSGIVAAVNLGNSLEKIRPIVERFGGAKRRQEILLERPIVLVDDFAHHPTEVTATLKAVRRRYGKGKLWALFEPRSATARRNVHQQAYVSAFDSADEILIASPYRKEDLKESESFSSETLVEALVARGKSAVTLSAVDEIVDRVTQGVVPGDVVVVMSNGEFGKIQEKIMKRLS